MLGPRIKLLRKNNGWPQEQLANMAGLKQVIVSRIERGNRKVTADELRKLAAALGVSVAELLDEAPSNPDPTLDLPNQPGYGDGVKP